MLGSFIAHPELLAETSGVDVWENPRKAAIEAAKRLGVDMIIQLVLPKSPEVSTTRADGGQSLFTARKEKIPYRSPEDVIRYIEALPEPEEVRRGFDAQALYNQYVTAAEEGQQECGDEILWLEYSGGKDCPFMYYSEFGYENYFMTITLYEDAAWKLFRYGAEVARLDNEVVAQAIRENDLPPFVYIGQDVCDNSGPMISVEALDRLYFPNLRYAIEPLSRAEIKMIWHSDGNINPIVDRLIDCGIDGFQGLQEDRYLKPHQIVDLEKMAKRRVKSGDKLILFGSVSVRSVLPQGSVEDVKREVERCTDAAADGGGFFLAPTSTAGPDIPKENLYTMYEYGNQYGSDFVQRTRRRQI